MKRDLNLLDSKNFKKGFLVDDQLMAGVALHESRYLAFVLNHQSGEYLGYSLYKGLQEALGAINVIQRNWNFEATGCSDGGCNHAKCKLKASGLCRAKSAVSGQSCH